MVVCGLRGAVRMVCLSAFFALVRFLGWRRSAVDRHRQRRIPTVFNQRCDGRIFSVDMFDCAGCLHGRALGVALANCAFSVHRRSGLSGSIQRTVLAGGFSGRNPAAGPVRSKLASAIETFSHLHRRVFSDRFAVADSEFQTSRLAALQHQLPEHRDGILS